MKTKIRQKRNDRKLLVISVVVMIKNVWINVCIIISNRLLNICLIKAIFVYRRRDENTLKCRIIRFDFLLNTEKQNETKS